MRKKLLALALVAPLSTLALDNSVTIHNASGSDIADRPVSLLMVFMRGEFPYGSYPKPRVGGNALSAWQTNVMSRWPDGSALTAFVSFPISILSGGSVVVDFVRSSDACHLGSQSVCEAAGLDASGMLGMSWDASIRGTANSISYSANARSMIGAGAWRYWYRGPVATRVIVEDMTTSLAYDFGWQWNGSSWQEPSTNDYKSAHPVFDISFWPSQGMVEVGWYLENAWRTRAQTLRFNLEMLGQSGSVVYSKTDYALGWRGAVSYYAWQPSEPPDIWIDRNFQYLVATKIFPPYDLTLEVPSSTITGLLDQWASQTGTDDQGRRDPRSCTTQNPCAYIKTDMPGTGDHLDFGIIPGPHVSYLYAMKSQSLTVPQKLDAFKKIILGGGDAAVTIHVHTRESYVGMTPSSRNYLMWPDDQSTPSFGRIFSVIAQYDARAFGYESSGAYPVVSRCSSNCPSDWHPWIADAAHHPAVYAMPYLLSGRYAYLSTLQQAAASLAGYPHPEYYRQRSFGILSAADPNNERIAARILKILGWAYLLSPDGPERNYFAKILRNNDSFYEGLFGINEGHSTSDCTSSYAATGSATIGTSGWPWPVNGSQAAFRFNYQGYGYYLNSISSLTVDGTPVQFGVYGQGGSYDWWFVKGTNVVFYTGQTPPSSSVAASGMQYYRASDPWCIGVAYRDGVDNPLAMLGGGGYTSDMSGTTSMLGGSPWMANYFYMHWGWLRDTEALEGFGARTGAAIAKRWIDGSRGDTVPIIYEKFYRSVRANSNGMIRTWSDYLASHSPSTTLASAIDSNASSLTISCSRCPVTLDAGSYIRVDQEWMEVASHSGNTITIARRGIWGTQAAPHSAGASIQTIHTRLGSQTGHTYSNLLHNAIAAYPEARTAWEKLVPLFTSGQSSRNTDLRYVLVPRSSIAPTGLRVHVNGSQALISYNSPDFGPCKIAIDPASSSDSGDQEDGGGSRSRLFVVQGLSSGQHQARVTCSFGRSIASFSIQ